MYVAPHHSLAELQEKARREKSAKPRVRLQAVILALQGEKASDIARTLGATERSVFSWVSWYNEQGLAGLPDAPRSGRPLRMTPELIDRFRARVEAGALPQDGVCTLRAVDLKRILKDEFEVEYSLNGVYWLLHHLGYSYLMPRPRHRQAKPEAQEEFKKKPRLSSKS